MKTRQKDTRLNALPAAPFEEFSDLVEALKRLWNSLKERILGEKPAPAHAPAPVPVRVRR